MSEKLLSKDEAIKVIHKLWLKNLPAALEWKAADYNKKNKLLDTLMVDAVLESPEWEFLMSREIKAKLASEMKSLTLKIPTSDDEEIKIISARIKAIKDIQKMNNWDSIEAPKDIKKVYVYLVDDSDYSIQHAGEEASVEDRIRTMKKLNHDEIK